MLVTIINVVRHQLCEAPVSTMIPSVRQQMHIQMHPMITALSYVHATET